MVTQLLLLDPRGDQPRRDQPRRDQPRRDQPRRDKPRRDGPALDDGYWQLDAHTREVGLRGVEEARRALAAAIERIGDRSAA